MHIDYKRVAVYVLMTINMVVGFSLLFIAQEFEVFRYLRSTIIDATTHGDPLSIIALLLLVLAFAAPLGTLLYALHPLKSWARVWFVTVSVLCIPVLIFVIMLFSDNWL